MPKILALCLVTLTVFFWGTNFNIGKVVVQHLSPLTASAIRFVLASLCLVPLMFIYEKKITIKTAIQRHLGMYIFLGFMGVAGFSGLFFLGLKYTTPVNGSLIMATNPLVTMLLAVIFLKDSIHIHQRIGLFFSLLGVMVVITHGSWDMLLHFKVALGDGIIMIANLCWALYGVLSRRYLHYSTPLITTTMTMIFGTVALVIIASYDTKVSELLHQTWQIYIALLYMALCGSVLAYLFWNYGIAHLGTGETAVFFNIIPVVTMLIAVFSGQAVETAQLIGGIIVIVGVLISTNVLKLPEF
jgi:drug/metabolite transporter (DMT)-like permease